MDHGSPEAFCSEGQAVTGGCRQCGCGEFHALRGQLSRYYKYARKTGVVWCRLELHICCSHRSEWSIGRKKRLSQASQCCSAARLTHQATLATNTMQRPSAWSNRIIVASSRSPQIRSAGELLQGDMQGLSKSSKSSPWLRFTFIPTKLAWGRVQPLPDFTPSTDHNATALMDDLSTQLQHAIDTVLLVLVCVALFNKTKTWRKVQESSATIIVASHEREVGR